MIRKLAPLLVALSSATAGCYTTSITGCWDFYSSSARNLGEEPVRIIDDTTTSCQIKQHAESAWAYVRKTYPEHRYSTDYAKGFKAGFDDYVDAGGPGVPPAVPPFCYRLSCYYGPDGHLAIQDWYAGFRHGAAVARHSGLREAILLPLSANPVTQSRPLPASPQEPDESPTSNDSQTPSGALPQELPAPRPLPASRSEPPSKPRTGEQPKE